MEVPTIRAHLRAFRFHDNGQKPDWLAELETAGPTREVMEVIKPKSKWAVRSYQDDDRALGIEEGIVREIEQQWQLLHRLVKRKFGVEAARRLAEASAQTPRPDFDEVFAAAMDCDTADEFVAWMGAHATPSTPVAADD